MRRSLVASFIVLVGVSLSATASAATSSPTPASPAACPHEGRAAHVELYRPTLQPSVPIGPNTTLWLLPAAPQPSTRLQLDARVERCVVGFPLMQGFVTKSGWLITPQVTSRGMSLMALSVRAGLVF